MLHQIYSDQSEEGALSQICMNLSKLHSIAVDLPKHGCYVDNDEIIPYKVSTYPDFINRKDAPKYTSRKALGVMFRNVDSIFQDTMAKYKLIGNHEENVDKD